MKILDKLIFSLLKRKVRRSKNEKFKFGFPSIAMSHENKVVHNQFLMGLAITAITDADQNSLADLAVTKSHLKDAIDYDIFPGEHYRLLRSLVKALGSRNVVEVGTSTGMSAIALTEGMNNQGRVTTFDLVPWHQFATHISKDLFEQGKVTQILADLSDPLEFESNRELIGQADLIFCDAPKDGVFEYKFLDLLTTIKPKSKRLLVLDDIGFLNMTRLWWSIESPKLDLTSFGHWSGTGLVDLSEGLRLRQP